MLFNGLILILTKGNNNNLHQDSCQAASITVNSSREFYYDYEPKS